MLFVGFAAALLVRVSTEDVDIKAFMARINPSKVAYQNCLVSQAAAMYRGRDSDELAQAILAACGDKRDAWMDAMMEGVKPEARAAAITAIQPLLPTLAHLAIATQVVKVLKDKQPGSQPAASTPSPRRAAPRERVATEDESAAAPTAPAAPAGPCGGISVPTDPSALSCR